MWSFLSKEPSRWWSGSSGLPGDHHTLQHFASRLLTMCCANPVLDLQFPATFLWCSHRQKYGDNNIFLHPVSLTPFSGEAWHIILFIAGEMRSPWFTPLDSFYFQIVGEVFRLSAQVGFAALGLAVEIRVSLCCAGGESTEHTPLSCLEQGLFALCSAFLALQFTESLMVAGKCAFPANYVQQFHRWRLDRCELFNFGYFFSCDNILERKWNLKILSFQLQTSKVWMLKADSEAVKANSSSYLILLCHSSNRRICVIGLYK